MFEQDTICAVATAPGGAIGIVRVSGPHAITITDKIFTGRTTLASAKTHTLHFGQIRMNDGSVLDEVLASVFKAPHSYTGEECVEISCHGSNYILQQICSLLVVHGCRGAAPGEFTQRAFLNNRLNLAQAEAVADVIAASNAAAHRLAMQQMRGNYSSKLKTITDDLLHLASLLELELDFSDHEDIEFVDREELKRQCQHLRREISKLADSFSLGNAIKNGIAVAIVGAPNVGKSTLLNALVHDDRAIVSDIQGTTRDTIDATFTIASHTFRFIDTAGLRATDDLIEKMGIERSLKVAQEAQIVLSLSDGREKFPEYTTTDNQTVIYILTKSDITDNKCLQVQDTTQSPEDKALHISALTGEGMPQLEQHLVHIADRFYASSPSDIIITNMRHYHVLLQSDECLQRVFDGLSQGIPNEFVAQDLRQCLTSLSEILGTGGVLSEQILSNIFSKFCIGK